MKPAVLKIILLTFFTMAFVSTGLSADRIVSLSPGLTEILFALGAGSEVVGVTDYCNYPPAALKRPKVGNGFRPSLEKIVSLRPTLVVGSVEGAEESLKKQLDNLGIKNRFYPSTDTQDIIYSIRSIGELLHMDSSKLTAGLKKMLNGHIKKTSTGIFLVGINPFSAAAGGTFVDDIMSCAGVQNLLEKKFKGYTIINYEYLLDAKPDFIFVSGSMGEAGLNNFMKRIKSAGVKSKIYRLDCDCFLRPSYRIKEACEKMREITR